MKHVNWIAVFGIVFVVGIAAEHVIISKVQTDADVVRYDAIKSCYQAGGHAECKDIK